MIFRIRWIASEWCDTHAKLDHLYANRCSLLVTFSRTAIDECLDALLFGPHTADKSPVASRKRSLVFVHEYATPMCFQAHRTTNRMTLGDLVRRLCSLSLSFFLGPVRDSQQILQRRLEQRISMPSCVANWDGIFILQIGFLRFVLVKFVPAVCAAPIPCPKLGKRPGPRFRSCCRVLSVSHYALTFRTEW